MSLTRSSSLFLILVLLAGMEESPASISEEAAMLEIEQTVVFVPIAGNGIIFFVPTGTGLPPDPLDSGKLTIQGIDSDNDGIRDDVERRISAYYPGNPAARSFSSLMARNYQQMIEDPLNIQLQLSLIAERGQIEDCLKQALPGEPKLGYRLLRPWVLDTYERSYAYVEARRQLAGKILPSIPKCQ